MAGSRHTWMKIKVPTALSKVESDQITADSGSSCNVNTTFYRHQKCLQLWSGPRAQYITRNGTTRVGQLHNSDIAFNKKYFKEHSLMALDFKPLFGWPDGYIECDTANCLILKKYIDYVVETTKIPHLTVWNKIKACIEDREEDILYTTNNTPEMHQL